MPVCAVHAPCLLITQRVWGTEPWGKLERSARDGRSGGRRRGRRAPAVPLAAGVRRAASSTASPPWRRAPASPSRSRTCTPGGRRSRRGMEMYLPGWDPSPRTTPTPRIDLSHAAIAQADAIEMAAAARRPAAPRAPDRRERQRQGRAPGPGPRRPGAPSSCEHLAGDRVRRQRGAGDQHPQGRAAGTRGRPTCAESLAFAREHLAVRAG